MLVLSRKENETIVIATPRESIVVKILKIKGNQIKIGLQSDREVMIWRGELLEQHQAYLEVIHNGK